MPLDPPILPRPEIAEAPTLQPRLELRLGDGTQLRHDERSIRRVELHEELGSPYRLRIDVALDGEGVDPASWHCAHAELELWRRDDLRVTHGVITRTRLVEVACDTTVWSIDVEPAVALARLCRRSRIFQDRNSLEIAMQVLGPLLAAHHRAMDVTRVPVPSTRDYCVQYDETDLDFVERILAEDGLAIAFEQQPQCELAIVVDGPGSLGELPNATMIPRDAGRSGERGIVGLEITHELRVDRASGSRWNWAARPGAVASEEVTSRDAGSAGPIREHEWIDDRRAYETPGNIALADDLASRVDRDWRRLAGGATTANLRSNLIEITAGAAIEIGGCADARDRRWCILSVQHLLLTPAPGAKGVEEPVATYTNDAAIVPDDAPWMPRVRARPRIHGVQTARVVGPPREEIHTDRLGRVKVHMHWDRDPLSGGDESCWLRVAQGWAGPGFGTLFVPRVGMEVLIAFVQGDPDQPIVIGCVYNGENDAPQALPEQRARTTWRSKSTPGGEGWNELTFDDDAGRERVYLRAQREMVTHVGGHRQTAIGASCDTRVGGDRSLTVQGSRTTSVKGLDDVLVEGARFTRISGTRPSPQGYGFEGDRTQVDGNSQLHVSGQASILAGSHPASVSAPAELWLGPLETSLEHKGSGTHELRLGGKHPGIVISSTEFIRLRVGQNELRIDAAGVWISTADGAKVEIRAGSEGSGSALTLDQQATLESAAAVTAKQGPSSLTLQGGARIDAPFTEIRGAGALTFASDGLCSLVAATATLTSELTCVQGTLTRITDGAGGAIEIAGGVIRLN